MRVVFVVPYAMDTSLRFLRASLGLEGVRVAVLTQEDPSRFPAEVRSRLVEVHRVRDAMDAVELERGARYVARALGGVDRLIGVLEQLQVPLATVRERLEIRGMGVEEAENFRDKARMKDLFRANDLPCARHALAHSKEEALKLADGCGYPLVVKPPAGAGARNTFRVEDRGELESYLRTLPPTPEQPVLLEEFIIGEEHSFDSMSVGGRHVFHSISQYYPTPLEVMETPWIQWCVLLPRSIDGEEYEDIHVAGKRVLDALGMISGMTHMEWFRRRDGTIAISEVAARPPGAQFTSLLSFAHDVDFYRAWSEVMIFETFDVPERRYAAGAAFLRGQGDGHVVDVQGLERVHNELGELVVSAKVPATGTPKSTSYEGEGFVILRHEDTDVVRKGLARLVKLLRVELG